MPYTIKHHGELRSVEPINDITEPQTIAYLIMTDNDVDLSDDEKEEIADDMERRCSCERDCCGHIFGGVSSITKIWDGEYIVIATYARNY